MMVLASRVSAAFLSVVSACARSVPSNSTSNTLPWRTLAIPATPSALRAPSMALPCGSSTPDFSVTVTRAFIARRPGSPFKPAQGLEHRAPPTIPRGSSSALHQDRPGPLGPLVLANDSEALCDLGIGLKQPAEVASEAILVQL